MTDNSQTFENHTSPDLRGGRCLQVAESAGAIAGATGRPRAGASRDGALGPGAGGKLSGLALCPIQFAPSAVDHSAALRVIFSSLGPFHMISLRRLD